MTATPTARPRRALLLAPAGADPALVSSLEADLKTLASQSGIAEETVPSLTNGEGVGDIIVVLPPDPGVAALAAASPNVQLVSVGIPGVSRSPNLTVIGPDGLRPDQVGFVAGFLAAVITPDYRVGVISTGDTPAGLAGAQGFLNGAKYYCGRCLPAYPPFHVYPASAEAADGSADAVQAALDRLIGLGITTVYLGPGIAPDTLASAGAGKEVLFLGSLPGGIPHWAATIRPSPGPALTTLWPDLLRGHGGQSLPLPIAISDVDSSAVSEGRLKLASQVLADLASGQIDTGVDLSTGQPN